MPIKILSPEVASQIAAGEVIERPASVVKELIENALDAGARQVTIIVQGAGHRLMEVADDGVGIRSEELPLAMERHATSKLDSAEDLFHIDTLGFRGEALASIGSVARLTITSRREEADTGARLRVEGGHAEPVQPIGSPVGTVVRVEDLFYNVPARLKFLKSDTTERRHIDKLVTRYALAYPQVRFHLRQEDRSALQTSGNGDRREILAALYGADIARQMLEVLSEDQGLNITGFISPVAVTRSHRRDVLFFVNGRPVQDAALSAALLKGYHTLLMTGRYPLGSLFLEMPSEDVDVNVHPTKAEVRFGEQDRIFSGVRNAVRRALLAYGTVPGVEPQMSWKPDEPWRAPSRGVDPAWGIGSEWPHAGAFTGERQSAGGAQPGEFLPADGVSPDGDMQQAPLPGRRVPLLRPVGQVANAYLVAEGPDGLYLIDQHAAHERVLFERFMAQRSEAIPSQALLQPVTVELPASSARLLSEQVPILESLGFKVEAFGPHTFLVRAIPALLADSDPRQAIHVLVEEFEEDETPLQAEVEARIIARVCKRAAVKAGQAMSSEEQSALVHDLEACQSPRTCPHGRPTMIHLSVDLLERQFGRRGAR